MARRVAIVGAGWAGLACAVELADAGIAVDVFEASRTLGGRARAVELDGLSVDNGQHILVGAYRETLRLIAKVGAGRTALARFPLHLEFPREFRLAAPALPLPATLSLGWALLTAQGLDFHDKLAALRFLRALGKIRFRLPSDIPASRLIANQPPRLRRFLWGPLCLAALNTPIREASAQVFLNVLRDTLAANRSAADLLLPATDLSSLFPEPAARFIEVRGGKVHRATRIDSLESLAEYDHRVLAVAPWHLTQLAPELALHGIATQPIATIYLHYPETVRLAFPMLGLGNGHGQWVFDRGLLGGPAGLLAVVISGAGPWQALDHVQLGWAIHRQLVPLLPGIVMPKKIRVIEEKRATFACTPNLVRPSAATNSPNLWLAGDYVAGDYPATLEGAVRSGIAVAGSILSS
ncbi:hydroxysqualene dehydroxylase HpnE [Sulfuricystis multivorans]|uniref:hydroxysqualene dehydroxylase HpnE n=1 Tax=Sulfuricystis multivorans TaxID=2211108 RepID=UPI000F83FBB5|nr:hydroxysqualene dehydroxylase HpnE [Sulfuricystis multivorans]